MKFKRFGCAILTVILMIAPVSLFYAENNDAVLSYTFEDESSAPELFGNAALVYDEFKQGNVLSLDGSEGTYAALTQGFFDNRSVMTISFDVLAKNNSGNYFTFTFGQNNEVYDYFRIKNDEIRNAITRWSYPNENEVKCTKYNNNIWLNIALVYHYSTTKLYINGELADENTNSIDVAYMDTDILSYFGKSFYADDGYFNGCFDNFCVYDRVLTNAEISKIAYDNIPSNPILRYTFDDDTALPSYLGNAVATYDSERSSNVLSLDGTDGTYAEIPSGKFDNMDTMTVIFDVKAGMNGGNYFTFAFGTDSNHYNFFRIRGTEIRNAITVNSYYDEREVKTNLGYTDAWINVALVFDGLKCALYINGNLADTNENTGIRISDLGSDLVSYFGKSMYDGDGYFKGSFDNFELYDDALSSEVIKNKAVTNLPLLLGVSVGKTVSNLDNVSGTDNHTAIAASIDRERGIIESIVSRRQNIKAVPVTVYSLNADCEIMIDNQKFSGYGLLDLTYDRIIKITIGERSESYTLKAVEIANNSVLPGMYADPDIDYLDGKFWIYPTTDGTPGWGGTQFHAFSSKDMVHWNDEGVILDNKNKSPDLNDNGVQIASSQWSDGNAWAPAIEEKNGKYYFYYCGRILESLEATYGEGMAIGVAWADSPSGPYTALSSPILYPKMMSDANFGFAGQVIDPSVYTEGDNSYLLFGNGMAAYVKLNGDMTSVDTSTLKVIEGLDEFRESIAVFKRGGRYYYTWSCDDTGSENYHINYGTSVTLFGRVDNGGTLLQKDVSSGILATGHQSVLYIPESDKCFIAYHRFYTPLTVGGNVGHRRETCIDEITFYGNTLNTVTPTMEGVGPVDKYGLDMEQEITYPTCTEDGRITYLDHYSLSADEATELKAAGHYFNTFTEEPSCKDGGFTTYFCTACGENYTADYTAKLGHELTVYCHSDAYDYTITCDRCGLDKDFIFGDYLNAERGNTDYDEDIDINGDGIINGRDLAYLKTQSIT